LIAITASARSTGHGAVASSEQRRAQVGQAGLVAPGGDAGHRVGADVGRLPGQAGQGGGEVDRVLAAAAG
jgi:hypothetical protein